MTSEPDECEALLGEVCNALFPYGKAFSPPERQAAASILRDHIEAKLAEVRAELDQAVFFIDLHKVTIAEQAAELERLREALKDIASRSHSHLARQETADAK